MVVVGRDTPRSPDAFLEGFDEEDPTGDWPLCETGRYLVVVF